jgi:lysozyme family protein
MQHNYDFAFEKIVGHEGGFTNSRHDRGNWTSGEIGVGELRGTKYGISAMAYPDLDIKSISLELAKDIYQVDYWNRIRGDALPDGVDVFIFDAAVNQGVRDAVKFLQHGAGVTVDGIIGPQTMAGVQNTDTWHLLSEASARRMHDYMLLDSLDDRYGLGWSRRLVDTTLTAASMLPG